MVLKVRRRVNFRVQSQKQYLGNSRFIISEVQSWQNFFRMANRKTIAKIVTLLFLLKVTALTGLMSHPKLCDLYMGKLGNIRGTAPSNSTFAEYSDNVLSSSSYTQYVAYVVLCLLETVILLCMRFFQIHSCQSNIYLVF